MGLKCTVLCLYCNGTACENIRDLVVDSEDKVDDILDSLEWALETEDEQDYKDSECTEPGKMCRAKWQKTHEWYENELI